ncbi:unnamed protein product [Timema podura]|uniref:Uncharacterized protein n=1 Tax=Timema podura TaxID=61482 RepID=A0ABN7NTI0_TIMPD|nr:unnamed protein product [Timema podura]
MALPPGVSAVKVKRGSDKQRRLGPAPFASFEDLSDDLESPEEKPALPTPLPGIQEDVRMAADGTLMSPESTASSSVVCGGTGSLQTPSTPRIDISRASSSSHQDSNNSSPERELFTGTGESGGITKLGLGFKEEGAADLRSSTEELDYHGEPKEKPAIKKLVKHELEAQSEKESQERKDSACSAISDVGLLSISGRTSRLSSVGSAASGGSVTSHVSHLSVVSGLSRASSGRSTSPHKMLLETSFCGSKPILTQSMDMDSPTTGAGNPEAESLEKMLLSRNIDPTRAVVGQEKEPQKPVTLNLSEAGKSGKPVQSFTQLVQSRPVTPKAPDNVGVTPTASPKPSRHAILKKSEDAGSRTPSPSLSRKSSFSIFKKSEIVMSPESPTVQSSKRKSGSFTSILKEAGEGLRDRSRSRSKSRERVTQPELKENSKGKKDNKNKNVFSNLFKKKDKRKGTKSAGGDVTSPLDISSPDSKLPAVDPIGNLEFTFNSDGSNQPSEFGMLRGEGNPEQRNLAKSYTDQKVLKSALEVKLVKSSSEQTVVKSSTDQKNAMNACQELINGVPESLLPSESIMLPTLTHSYHESEPPESKLGKDYTNKEELCTDAALLEHLSLVEEGESTTAVSASEEAEHHSSESERDSELDYNRTNKEALKKQEGNQGEMEDHERKRLVLQDSFEDELPYVPTTLPLERSVAVPIVPIKQRISEVRTCPIERPRSTTPINPSLLEDYVYCKSVAEEVDQTIDKIRINLPREDSINRGKNSRKASGTAKSWLEFAEHGLNSPREYRRSSPTSPPPPPLPPRAQPIPPPPITPPPKPTSWINFEEIPEKRKPPKRIQTIPSRGTVDLPEASKVQSESSKTVVYSYVNPEDCKCECHETTSKLTETHKVGRGQCSHKEAHQHSSNRVSPESRIKFIRVKNNNLDTRRTGMAQGQSIGAQSQRSWDETQSPELGSPVTTSRTHP